MNNVLLGIIFKKDEETEYALLYKGVIIDDYIYAKRDSGWGFLKEKDCIKVRKEDTIVVPEGKLQTIYDDYVTFENRDLKVAYNLGLNDPRIMDLEAKDIPNELYEFWESCDKVWKCVLKENSV